MGVRGYNMVVGDIPPLMFSFGLTTKDPSIETNIPDLYLEWGDWGVLWERRKFCFLHKWLDNHDFFWKLFSQLLMKYHKITITCFTLEGNLPASHMIDWCIQTLWKVYLSKIELWNCTIIKRLKFFLTKVKVPFTFSHKMEANVLVVFEIKQFFLLKISS